ncbi:MAG: hypothetical protein M3Y07_10365 [Acidobacteriota bacterium]|nr:hypothetical protein [Acidobacteriota bacterium]
MAPSRPRRSAHATITLRPAERYGIGTTDLTRVEVAGAPIAKALYRYES